MHVDDFIWCGNISFETQVINNLRNTFQIGKEESSCFQYLGLQLKQSLMGISFDQDHYIKNISEIESPISADKNQDVSLSDELKDALRSKVSQLLWVANQTRPDISFDVSSIAVSLKNATYKDIATINKVIRKVKNHHLYFSSLVLEKLQK